MLTTENITENVHLINSTCPDGRLRFLLERLVTHLHDFVRETRLNTSEWEAAIKFLTEVGQISSDVRHEFILLSDILGLSLLVDSIDHPKPPASTEGTVLGPFHHSHAPHQPHGASIIHDEDGDPMLVIGTVKDTHGNPISGVRVDVWETDSNGFYDVQYEDHTGPNGRAVMETDENGEFWFNAAVPVPYPIPHDGPVGKLLQKLKRHPYRPSHFHFMLEKPHYDRLITALYRRGDPYEKTDAVFGVKDTLVIDLYTVADIEGLAEKYGVSPSTKLLKYDFVLVSDDEVKTLRHRLAEQALQELDLPGIVVINGMLVPECD
ncbi:Intradiol ring-cleavage dioxygenase [Boeremia exigua]|uniref:Intradiol ring-cleavage dioxygenase n=1 Tax=Boeremia exigua TaxID=749465 RepID=UPI001E8D82E9|nr:Intradiol ring-cleavage dioxygenase [Boeremia exigua]KAH6616417.1 Intradiol ring-cleavage dioxygenase [Boeremia exigua]